MVTAALSRPIIGFGLLVAAIATRCLAAFHGGVLMTFGPHVPALTRLDLITAPVAVLGIAVLAAGRGLPLRRRLLGLIVLVAAIALPALKLADMGPVLLVVAARHGVHSHDLIVVPMGMLALALLAPWRSPLWFASTAPAGRARVLRPVVQQ